MIDVGLTLAKKPGIMSRALAGYSVLGWCPGKICRQNWRKRPLFAEEVPTKYLS